MSGSRRSRARRSTRSSTASCATPSTRSFRVPTASSVTFASRAGSSRCPRIGARTGRSSSRTTTSRRSSSRGAPGWTRRSSCPRPRPLCASRACGPSRSAPTPPRCGRSGGRDDAAAGHARRPRPAGARQGALTFTEHTGLDELRRAFEQLLDDGNRLEAAATAADLSVRALAARRRRGQRDLDGACARARRGRRPLAARGARSRAGGAPRDARGRQRGGGRARRTGDGARDRDRCEAVRVAALITRATAKANFADYDRAREDLEEAAELALASDPSEAGRAYVNLGSVLRSSATSGGRRNGAPGDRDRRADGDDRRLGRLRVRQPRRGAVHRRRLGRGRGDVDRRARARGPDRGPLPGAAVQARARRARVRPGRSRGGGGGDREEPGRGGP